MRSDIILEGKYANIINDIKATKIMKDSNADLFFIAVLMGLFHGETAEDDIDDDVKAEVTRTWINSSNRVNLKLLVNTFANLQQKLDNSPLSLTEIFNDDDSTNSNDKLNLIKSYGLRGLEIMEEEIFNERSITDEIDVINFITSQLKTEEEIRHEVSSFDFKPNTDDDILDIVESMDE